ncbi:MAG: dipeptidase [Gemmatimonadota bacterium]
MGPKSWSWRRGLTAGVLVLVGCGGPAAEPAPEEALDAAAPTEEEIVALAQGIHQRVIALDTHVDIPFDFASDSVDPGVRGTFQVDLPKMREGGLDAAFFVVYHAQEARTPAVYAAAHARAMQKFAGIRRMVEELYPNEIELALTAADVERISAAGKLVALIGVENIYPIGTDLSTLEEWHALGARYASLTHNGHSQFGDAAVELPALGDDGPEWGGLSPLGEAAVDELNRLGIVVDVSHAHKLTMLDIAARSRAPIIASHSSIRAVADHPRNLDDEQLLAIRDNGGVIQTTALDAFVKIQPPAKAAAYDSLFARFEIPPGADMDNLNLSSSYQDQFNEGIAAIELQYPAATVRDYVDHIDYAVRLIGVDHVGISSDFDGGGGVEGWQDASETFNVTLELVRRGYTEVEVQKLWGGNLLRVMQEVEEVARGMRVAP